MFEQMLFGLRDAVFRTVLTLIIDLSFFCISTNNDVCCLYFNYVQRLAIASKTTNN